MAFDATNLDRARWRTYDGVRTVAQILDGEGVLVRREDPLGTRFGTVVDVEPLAGVKAALFVHNVAQERINHYAKAARSEGRTWEQIGEALNLAEAASEHDLSLAAAAFYLVVDRTRPGWTAPDQGWNRWESSLSWRCGTCHEFVNDRGPFDSLSENETGHAENCSRHAAELAAFHSEGSW